MLDMSSREREGNTSDRDELNNLKGVKRVIL